MRAPRGKWCSMSAIDNFNYEEKTYDQLSEEFKKLFPTAHKALQLIPQMYNRLTYTDKLSHKKAFDKICKDHKKIEGFSRRNARRYLPKDNPNVPHRVRPPRPKSSPAKLNYESKLSNTNDSPLAARRENKKEFLIPVDTGQIQRYIQKHQLTGDLSSKIWVMVYLDIDAGKVLSSSVEEPHDYVLVE